MSWKKSLLIVVAVVGLGFMSAPRTDAQVSIGIGFGVPVGYGYYGPGYYSTGYYPYRYGYARSYYAPVRVAVRPHYHWSHGRRIYCTARHRYWR